jgi:asparagine synthase (glutamine-hydrolysing)
MCGLAGFLHRSGDSSRQISHLGVMLDRIRHRGPDDGGTWVDASAGVGLGHRRLSILDLSPAGRQPMSSQCSRFVLVFNGEIYNHASLRQKLEDANVAPPRGWYGHSDTETLLGCFVAWGIDETLRLTVGMFALALWDRHEKTLTLARDRVGEKPIYYGWNNDVFLFGSELKALQAHPEFRGEINWDAARSFLHLNFVPSPSSIFKDIFKLPPGMTLVLTQQDIQGRSLPAPSSFWTLAEAAERGTRDVFGGSFFDAVDELDSLIRRSVKLQSIADVRVGAFLSGGVDSSTVVAMMQAVTTSSVTTFSIGMSDAQMDESGFAAAIARHLGTNHIEHIIQPKEVLELIHRLPAIWDEPLGDSSQIPTYVLSRLAKEHVTVALSGDGGDEFFLGYPQYSLFQRLWRTRLMGRLPWNLVVPCSSRSYATRAIDRKLRFAASIVGAWRQPNPQQLNYYWMDRYRQDIPPLRHNGTVALPSFPTLPDAAVTAGLFDAGTYLPDDILVKVDRASMANSLETRAPLLDHRIIEFAYRLPADFKIKDGFGKRVLREVLARYVPRPLFDRPKMGFSIPMSSWLRGELRPWATHLLDQIRSHSDFFDDQKVELMWQEHLSNQRDHTERLWGVLSLMAFIEAQ